MLMPACLQRCMMVAASSSTKTPTADAPPARAAAAMAAAVSSLTARFAFGHIIMPAWQSINETTDEQGKGGREGGHKAGL